VKYETVADLAYDLDGVNVVDCVHFQAKTNELLFEIKLLMRDGILNFSKYFITEDELQLLSLYRNDNDALLGPAEFETSDFFHAIGPKFRKQF
jgi:hypothetical protein